MDRVLSGIRSGSDLFQTVHVSCVYLRVHACSPVSVTWVEGRLSGVLSPQSRSPEYSRTKGVTGTRHDRFESYPDPRHSRVRPSSLPVRHLSRDTPGRLFRPPPTLHFLHESTDTRIRTQIPCPDRSSLPTPTTSTNLFLPSPPRLFGPFRSFFSERSVEESMVPFPTRISDLRLASPTTPLTRGRVGEHRLLPGQDLFRTGIGNVEQRFDVESLEG